MSKLSDRLAQAKRDLDNITAEQMVKKARAHGYVLSDYSAKVYVNGSHSQNPKRSTLEALAFVLDVPLNELLELAGLPVESEHYEAPESADLLTAPQRAAVNEIIRLLADGNRNSNASTPPLPDTQEQDAQGEEAGEKTGDLVDFPPPPPAGKAAALKPDHGSRDVDEWQLGQERGEEPDPIPDYDESQDPDEHDHGGDE